MRYTITYLLASLSIFCFALDAKAQVREMEFPDDKEQHIVRADDIAWKPCPPHLPKGCQIAILEGSPKEEIMFTVRFKVDKEMIMPPHTHPRNERVTILEGAAFVGFGKEAKKENANKFGPGDYYVNKNGSIHSVWIEAETILQITGIGPWEVDYVE